MKKYYYQDYKYSFHRKELDFNVLLNKILKKKFYFELFLDIKSTRLGNFCYALPRQRRSITNFFHLSRMFVKKFFCLGKINALRKIS